jgi:hypothetical protein
LSFTSKADRDFAGSTKSRLRRAAPLLVVEWSRLVLAVRA